jgi:Protein of unknown function (DUF2971)
MITKNAGDLYLYRILGFDRVIQIFESGKLYFAHPSKWEDPFENVVEHKAMQSTFAQCWCSKGVSDAMWRIYSPDKIGVRIKIKKSTLTALVKSAANAIGAKAKIKKVAYLPESEVKIKIASLAKRSKSENDPTVALNVLFYKRLAYSHEQEYRAVIYDASSKNGSVDKGLTIAVNPHALIDSVLFDPRAPDEVVKAFELYLKKSVKFKKHVGKSTLYRGVEKIEL